MCQVDIMIVVTGDSLGIDALYNLAHDETVCSMSKSDYLVVLGNCGIMQAHTDFQENILIYRDLPCSVLFLDGGHDDYDLIADHPLFPWNGGMVQNISRGLTHLMRGQVFTIGGRTLLTMGGSTTPGRDDVGKYYDWWPEQDIFPPEVEVAERNLSAVGDCVDLVLTCECPTSWKSRINGMPTPCSDALERILGVVDYGHWYFSGPSLTELPDVSATMVGHEVVALG